MKIFKISSEINLWLDDERDPKNPDTQRLFGANGSDIWVKTIEEAISYLEKGVVSSISFDNDLGEGKREGRHLAAWIEERAYFRTIQPLKWKIHSQNPNGRKEIMQAMENADRYWKDLAN